MKRFVSLALILCLLPLSGGAGAATADGHPGRFADIYDAETQLAAEMLYNLGIITGTGGGGYTPDGTFNRAMLAVIAVKLAEIFDVSSYGGTVRFPDVRAGYWAHPWIMAAVDMGLVTGGSDGNYNPGDPMRYSYLATVLMRLLGYADADVGLNWPHGYIAKAEALGLSKGMKFSANDILTRGQVARLVYNFLFMEFKEGGVYIQKVFGTKEAKTLLIFDVADGKTFIGDYVYHGVLDDALQYRYADLLVDKNGKVLTLEMDKSVTYREASVKTARDSRLELADGSIVPVSGAADVYDWDGERSDYKGSAFLAEETVKLAIRDGAVLYIMRDSDDRRIGLEHKSNFLLRMRTAGGKVYAVAADGTEYPVKGVIDAAQTGRMGVLSIDRDENALSFTPAKGYTYQTVTVASILSTGFFDGEGTFIRVPGTTDVWSDEADKYNAVWEDIQPHDVFLLAYNDAERLQYIYRVSARGGGDYILAILEKQPQKGSNPLPELFGKVAADAVIYKNGYMATLDMLEKWDVLLYYERSNTVEACNIRLAGVHSNPRPNPMSPTALTLLGREFTLLPEATARMSQYPVGQRFTFFLAPDGYSIADMRSTDEVASTTIGLAKSGRVLIGASSLELSGTPASAELPLVIGRVGRVQGSADSKIYITPIETQSGRWGDLNLAAKRLGSVPLAPWCVIYDQVGGAGRAERISLSDIPVNRVRADQVLYADISPSGYVTAVILDDISGDAYIYGMADNMARVGTDSLGEPYVEGYDVRISNGSGSSEWLICDDFIPPFPQKGAIMGASVTNTSDGNGFVTNLVSCIRYSNLTRLDFNGDKSVRIGGNDVPLAASVTEVFIPSMDEYMDIATARAYCKTFEVYTDPWEYKVRFIIGRV